MWFHILVLFNWFYIIICNTILFSCYCSVGIGTAHPRSFVQWLTFMGRPGIKTDQRKYVSDIDCKINALYWFTCIKLLRLSPTCSVKPFGNISTFYLRCDFREISRMLCNQRQQVPHPLIIIAVKWFSPAYLDILRDMIIGVVYCIVYGPGAPFQYKDCFSLMLAF